MSTTATTIAAAFGIVMTRELEESGVPPFEAARLLGISQRTLARTLTGTRPMLIHELEALSMATGASVTEITDRACRIQAILDKN